MSFPYDLPGAVRALYQKHKNAPALWPLVVQEAVKLGYRSRNQLTDLVFYMHHPERVGKPIQASETSLVAEWKGYRGFVDSAIPSWSKAAEPSLVQLLEDVDREEDLGGRSLAQRLARFRLYSFLLRAMKGERVDDRFWSYQTYDHLGREFAAIKPYQVHSFETWRETRAVADFKRRARGATTAAQARKHIGQLEDTISTYVGVLVRWATVSAGTGDASTSDFREARHFERVVRLSKQTSPESVFSIYRRLLVKTHGNWKRGSSQVFPTDPPVGEQIWSGQYW